MISRVRETTGPGLAITHFRIWQKYSGLLDLSTIFHQSRDRIIRLDATYVQLVGSVQTRIHPSSGSWDFNN